MKCWLGKQQSGLYMLTHLEPVLHRLYGSRQSDLYVPYGDALGIRHLCEPGVKRLFGVTLEVCEVIEVELKGERS